VCAPPIFILFTQRSPTTIARLVITVVVNTVNRPPFGFFAHIGKKVFKSVPSFANLNAAFTVMAISGMTRISASIKHRAPYSINFRICLISAMSVSWFIVASAVLGHHFILQASAGSCVISSQISAKNFCLFSTRTTAEPLNLPSRGFCAPNNS
jgi:hypothetical protein